MKEKILQFLHDEDGLTMVEYAVAGALIAAALVGAFVSFGDQVTSLNHPYNGGNLLVMSILRRRSVCAPASQDTAPLLQQTSIEKNAGRLA